MKEIINKTMLVAIGAIIGYMGLFYFSPHNGKSPVYHVHGMDYMKIMHAGDVETYLRVVDSIRTHTPSHPDYFEFSLQMAHKYNYLPANYDVYRALVDVHELNGLTIASPADSLAQIYLQRYKKRKRK